MTPVPKQLHSPVSDTDFRIFTARKLVYANTTAQGHHFCIFSGLHSTL